MTWAPCFRRRYWHLAHAGGIFVEAIESAEPWKLENRGLNAPLVNGTEAVAGQPAVVAAALSSLDSPPPTKKLKLEVKEEENKVLYFSTSQLLMYAN